jgi:glycosyltransferase involved in cell wall biosynthesis
VLPEDFLLKNTDLSVVIPAKNEELNIKPLVEELVSLYPDAEIIVVNDGSTDTTPELAREAGARVVDHPYSKGNGAAIKAGAREATGEIVIFMDGDGQHKPADISRLLDEMARGMDMAVGARSDKTQASMTRRIGNGIYNLMASYMTNTRIPDLTSGFRAVKRELFMKFLYLLPNGFSYPTTITMAFFRAGYSVAYVPIEAGARAGKSHINIVRDGVKFFLIIFKVGTLYSPLKVFFPVALAQASVGLIYYIYTFLTLGRLTNMSVIVIVSALTIFLIGLISEQITALMYRDTN